MVVVPPLHPGQRASLPQTHSAANPPAKPDGRCAPPYPGTWTRPFHHTPARSTSLAAAGAPTLGSPTPLPKHNDAQVHDALAPMRRSPMPLGSRCRPPRRPSPSVLTSRLGDHGIQGWRWSDGLLSSPTHCSPCRARMILGS
ncbi:hypothetical protein VPH35_089050 [Triticum aestivum]